MTRFAIFKNSSPVTRYTQLLGRQASNALRDVHPVPDYRAIGMKTARPKDEQRAESQGIHQSDQSLTHPLARMPTTPSSSTQTTTWVTGTRRLR